MQGASSSRSAQKFLFLQGNIGPFFQCLGHVLTAQGVEVHRINFNGGDWAAWNLPGAVDFQGSLENWPDFLSKKIQTWGITDVCLFGDCRPLHRIAIDSLRHRSVAIHVFEEGYLRPDWITLESGGVNGYSSLPKNIEWYLEQDASLDSSQDKKSVNGRFSERAFWDVIYNAAVVLMKARYPQYTTHKPWPVSTEYMAGARRFFRRASEKRAAKRQVARLIQEPQRNFLFPLQLDSDSQVRYHSPFGGMTKAIEFTLDSFAKNAAPESRLIFTEHPLDNGVVPLRRIVRRAALERSIDSRVIFLDGGSPMELLGAVRGIVTVNSTIGILALSQGKPVKVLGNAIYDLPLLTHQGDMDLFWSQPAAPQTDAVRAFIKTIKAKTQVNGCYFSRAGRLLAAEIVRDKLLHKSVAPLGAQPELERLVVGPAMPESA